MIVTPTVRVIVPTLLFVAACGAALVFGVNHMLRERSVAAGAMNAVPIVPPRSSAAQNQDLAGLAQAQAEAAAVMGGLAVPPSTPDAGAVPTFDIARIEPTGEAVIAGRAAPGATVELLFDGKVYDRAIADQAGQFVMIPPRLPPGDHELTLRSGQRDGKQVTSIQSVSVALNSRPSDAPLTYKMSEPVIQITKPQQSISVTLHPSLSDASPTDHHSRPTIRIAKRRGVAAFRKQQTTAPAPLLDEHPPSVMAASNTATRVVSGGDSLWRISRLNYGNGERYPVIYDANRNQIQNPNRIFPGQVIVIPDKAH
jgi:nucleoid-associated protein YgaU